MRLGVRLLSTAALTGAAGLALAALSFVAVLFLARPATVPLGHLVLGPGVYAEYAATGFAAALAWVWVGAQVVPDLQRRLWLAVPLFAAGAYLARELVWSHDSSPCHGLAELAAAYLGGGLGVILAGSVGWGGRRRPGVTVLAAGLLLPPAAFVLTAVWAWRAPQFGHLAYVHLGGGQRVPVRWTYLEPSGPNRPGGRGPVMWSVGESIDAVARATAAGPLLLETDLGSGPGRAQATPLPPITAVRAALERAAEAGLRRGLATEIREGYSAPGCAALRLPRAELAGASFYRVIWSGASSAR